MVEDLTKSSVTVPPVRLNEMVPAPLGPDDVKSTNCPLPPPKSDHCVRLSII